ncbi:DUF4199 domain-containing protein [Pontibacter sp. MBLB2868]|uniref:DUF4199 domain-containing protein n=1 Tax=Pontibacter sp. MBLB2868 TaxID=3451555 RepID=UPI003F7514A1
MNKFSIEIKWAIAFVLMTFAWIVIEKLSGMYTTNIDKHVIFTNFIAIPAITIYVLALLDKRRNYYNGTMTYKQGLISGLIITLLVTAFSPVTQLVVSNIIAPEYFPNMIAYALAEGKMTLEEASSYFTLKNYMIQGLIGAPVMGLLTTVVVALFTRTKSPKAIVAQQ